MSKQMTEMLKGTLEGIVLAVLATRPAYGYDVTARLREQGATVLSEPMATPVCRMSVVADPEGNAVILHRVND